MAKTLFLSLDDAVIVANREFGIDKEIARNEFMQKCYLSDNQYGIGYSDALYDVIKRVTKMQEEGD